MAFFPKPITSTEQLKVSWLKTKAMHLLCNFASNKRKKKWTKGGQKNSIQTCIWQDQTLYRAVIKSNFNCECKFLQPPPLPPFSVLMPATCNTIRVIFSATLLAVANMPYDIKMQGFTWSRKLGLVTMLRNTNPQYIWGNEDDEIGRI